MISPIDNFGRLFSGNYFLYITTNPRKTTLYIGVTNNLYRRILQHTNNKGNPESFAGKYYCYLLVYWERYSKMRYAIAREKQIKKWRREKKDRLISDFNPEWRFLNDEIDG